MHKGIIYKATNKSNGKVYIGQTARSLEERIRGHLASTSGAGTIFSTALKTFGIDAFKWEIVDSVEADTPELLKSFLAVAENYHIMKNKSFLPENGYNTIGARSGRGMQIRKGKPKPIRDTGSIELRSTQARPIALYGLDGSFMKYFATAVLARNYTNKAYFFHTTETSVYMRNGGKYRGVLLHLRSKEYPPERIQIIAPD